MNRNPWITIIVVAIVFAGGGYYFGAQSAATKVTTGTSAYAGRTGGTGRFTGAAGAAGFGGGTIGTIISTGTGSFTIQLPASTSTTATTGTKIVLYDDSTMVSELESVPATSLTVGQSVVVTGTTNSDGSETATSIQVRPASMGTRGGATTGTGGGTNPATTQ